MVAGREYNYKENTYIEFKRYISNRGIILLGPEAKISYDKLAVSHCSFDSLC